METVDLKFIDSVLEKHGGDKAKIIAIMQDVQEEYRYLPQDALEYIAKKLGMSESKLYGVATFYGNFSLDAKGKYVMKVCRGTACHVRKSSNILQALYDAIRRRAVHFGDRLVSRRLRPEPRGHGQRHGPRGHDAGESPGSGRAAQRGGLNHA